MTVEELKMRLEKCYSKELCYPKIRCEWKPSNKCLGMCAITCLLVQDYFGGAIKKVHVDGISHYFNFIEKRILDLTKDQFGHPIDYSNCQEVSREALLTEDTMIRYQLLKHRLEELK